MPAPKPSSHIGFTHMLPNTTWQMPPHLINQILGAMSGSAVLTVASTMAGNTTAADVDIGAELSSDKKRCLCSNLGGAPASPPPIRSNRNTQPLPAPGLPAGCCCTW